MPLEIECPGCSTRYRIGEDKAGKRVRCRRCQAVIPVPVGAPEDDPFNVFDNPGDSDFFGASGQTTAGGSAGNTFDDGADDPFGGFDMGAAFSAAPSMPSPQRTKSKKKKQSPPPRKGGGDDAMFIGIGIAALVVIGLAVGAFIYFAGRRDQGGGGGGGGVAQGGFGNEGGGDGSGAHQGSLAAGDQTLPGGSGELIDTYTIEGVVGQRVSLALSSEDFDTYLMLETPSGDVYENDDAGGLSFSAIRMPLPENGSYKVTVTSYEAGETGNYELYIALGAQATARVEQGTLADGDSAGASGALEDTIVFQGRRGQRAMVLMTSDEFDALVRLIGPNGMPLGESDDAGSGSDSMLTTILPADGEYRVQATSYEPGSQGAYTVVIDQTEPVDRIETGSLNVGDQTLLDTGEFYDTFTINGQRGQRISISLSSTEFDPYLLLIAPSEEQFDNDDFIAGSPNSEIVMTLPENGQYEVGVTSFEPGETGSYILAIDFE